MKLLFSHLKKYKKLLWGTLLLAAINQVFSLIDPQIFRLIIDRYATRINEIPREEFIQGVILLLLASVGVAFVSRVAKNFQDYYVNVVSQRVGAGLYEQSVSHAFSLPYEVFEDQRSGELLSKLERARTDSQKLIEGFVNIVFLSLVGTVFVLIYAFIVHWMVGAVYLLIIPTLGGATFLISRRIKAAQTSIVREAAALGGSTTETLRNVELVKSLGLEEQETSRLNRVNEDVLQLELKKVRLVRTLSFIQGTLINALRSGLLFLMLWLIFRGSMTLGEFFSLLFYSFFVFNPLSEFGTVATQYQEAKASNEELQQVLTMEPEERPEKGVRTGTLKSLAYERVGFSYTRARGEALKDISFAIQGGETVAFVGPSGSGKSTIVKLMVGLYRPTEGKIAVNGIPINELDIDEFRSKIGFVAQETQLFAGTIRENLRFVRPDASDAECEKVLELASVTSILERGSDGLDTKIGEGGMKISGGERQRLAIARALLRNPELLIFDEATSSLDSLTEQEIARTIRHIGTVRRDLMTVLIAHRLSTVTHATRIYVLGQGRIEEKGTHEELVQEGGLYAALWREQTAGLRERELLVQ